MAGLVNQSSIGLGLDSISETVGTGPAGFGGLSWKNALSRWIQASTAPDLVLPELVKMFMPVFFILMVLEVIALKYNGKPVHSLRQSWSNLGAGATMYLILGIFIRGLSIFPYMALHNRFALNKSEGFWTHMIVIFGVDLGYYLAHRWEHVANAGWATHNMHHSSPDYNFVTSFRQGPDQLLVNWVFYLPISFFAPVKLFYFYYGALYSYQFLMHTELVGKLHPIIEYIFITPSHHRVHHARNYPRANFGGVMVIWDRLFNTFVPEQDDKPCVYGLDERQIPLGTHNPLWQQGHHFWYTMKGVMEAKGFEKLRVLFTRVHVDGMIAPAITDSNKDTVPMPPDGIPCDPRVSWIDAYVTVQGGLCFPVAMYILAQTGQLPVEQTIAVCFLLIFSFITILTLMDEFDKQKAVKYETCRLTIVAAMGFWLLSTPFALALSIFCSVSTFAVHALSSETKSHTE